MQRPRQPSADQQPWGQPADSGQPGAAQQPWAPGPGPAVPGWAAGPAAPGSQQPWSGQPVWGPPPGSQDAPWGAPQPGHYGGPSPYRQHYVAPPKPGIIPLRPLMFGEILDGSFQTIRRNAKAMLGASLLAQSLAAVLTAVLTALSATSGGFLQTWAEGLSREQMLSIGIGSAAGLLLFSVLTVLISAVLQGAMVVPVARSVLNRRTGFRQMWALAKSRAGALIRLAFLLLLGALTVLLIFAAFAVGLISSVGPAGGLILFPLGLALFVLLMWVYIKLMVAPAAIVIEELGAREGLRRSWELTRGNWWRILGITLVVGFMVGIIAQVVMIPVSLLSTFFTSVVSPHGGPGQAISAAVTVGVVTAIIGALVGAVGYAFQTSVMALLYLDLRMRKDGLDISLLRLLESGADADGVPGRGVPVYRNAPGYGAPSAYGTPPDVR
ncbi:glycerophosphoryl diester phosphodiesterase membrane domain-containing protein [Arthrobacter sp. D1-29]